MMGLIIWLFEWWLVFVAIAAPFALLLSLSVGRASSPNWHAVERRSQAEIRQAALNLKARTVFWWL
jgi:hypothetical protein